MKQNIPSGNKEIRMLFKAKNDIYNVTDADKIFKVAKHAEVKVPDGWKFVSNLKAGDIISCDDEDKIISSIKLIDNYYIISYT